jgi:hypothetical protein
VKTLPSAETLAGVKSALCMAAYHRPDPDLMAPHTQLLHRLHFLK